MYKKEDYDKAVEVLMARSTSNINTENNIKILGEGFMPMYINESKKSVLEKEAK